jgi:2-polyprenyl-3-methyl-5-hydroxy-6-metoxy-1,4-benzoquinol methylase
MAAPVPTVPGPATDGTHAGAGAAFDAATAARIAAAFRPSHWYGNHTAYFYTRAKLRSDPLYPGVVAALRGCDAPLLDLGCGMGLLAHALRDAGLGMPCRGVDIDAPKIAQAQRAAANAGLRDARFEVMDLSTRMPAHHGSVAILDVLQFVSPAAQAAILDAAVAMVAPGARLVIRTGLDDGSARARTTRRIDALSRALRWMNAGPQSYPDPAALRARFDAAGLASTFSPLYGRTPFNNWLVVATR